MHFVEMMPFFNVAWKLGETYLTARICLAPPRGSFGSLIDVVNYPSISFAVKSSVFALVSFMVEFIATFDT